MVKTAPDSLSHSALFRTPGPGNDNQSFIAEDTDSVDVRQLFQRFTEWRSAALRYSCDSEQLILEKRKAELLQIFFSWLSTCVVYNTRNAEVHVDVELPDKGANDAVQRAFTCTVECKGMGISPKRLSTLFYRFCRTEAKRIRRAKLRAGHLFTDVTLDMAGGTIAIETRRCTAEAGLSTRLIFTCAQREPSAAREGQPLHARADYDCHNDIVIENVVLKDLPAGVSGNQQEAHPPVDGSKHADEQFLTRLMSLLESHISDPDFNVSKLVSEIGMSRPVLFRKAKILTGSSIINLIRSRRLKMAETLLKQKKVAVSEVAFKVGYTDPKYFSKSFRSEYGKTPREYAHGL